MPLGTEADIGAGQIVLDGDPACPPPRERGTVAPSPLFGPQRSPISDAAELLF